MVLYKLKMATRVGFRPRVRCSDVTAQIRSLPLLSCGAAHRYATRRHARLRPPRTFRPHSPGPGGPPGAVGGSRYAACKIGPTPPKMHHGCQRWLCARIRRAAFADRPMHKLRLYWPRAYGRIQVRPLILHGCYCSQQRSAGNALESIQLLTAC
eukprot:COSAG01_NODE_6565_length_3606_cov_8.416881_1_plen_154_part_00